MGEILQGDVLEQLRTLKDNSVHCVITSPPYWSLRSYDCDGQLGLESTPEEWVENLVNVFDEVHRVLRPTGTVFLNIGDCWAADKGQGKEIRSVDKQIVFGHHGENYPKRNGYKKSRYRLKPKDMIGLGWRLAFALQYRGWYLRSCIVWNKPNVMPSSVKSRPTQSHEYVFFLVKSEQYYFDSDAIAEPCKRAGGYTKRAIEHAKARLTQNDNRLKMAVTPVAEYRNARTVWEIAPDTTSEKHFATFPRELVHRCLRAGCPPWGVVLDPFAGSGTTCIVAEEEGRDWVGIELSVEYVQMAKRRIRAMRVKRMRRTSKRKAIVSS